MKWVVIDLRAISNSAPSGAHVTREALEDLMLLDWLYNF
jgi:hypothetical protein